MARRAVRSCGGASRKVPRVTVTTTSASHAGSHNIPSGSAWQSGRRLHWRFPPIFWPTGTCFLFDVANFKSFSQIFAELHILGAILDLIIIIIMGLDLGLGLDLNSLGRKSSSCLIMGLVYKSFK